MNPLEPFATLGTALAVGLLIGLERELGPARPSFLGGVRTHPLVALVGALSMLAANAVGGWIVLLAFAGIAGLVAISYADDVRHDRDRVLTSAAAILVTFLLGALAPTHGIIEPISHRVVVVSAVAVVTTFLLSAKAKLHAFARSTTRDDIIAVAKFLIVGVVVLPLLPNRTLGPLDAINPFQIGWMVVLIAGTSFVGYAAIRLVGPRRGVNVTGLVGGLVSSTAVTLAFAGRARNEARLAPACAVAVTLASSIMFLRVVGVVAFVHPPLVPTLLAPMLAMAVTGALASVRLERALPEASTDNDVSFANPFELGVAVRFALLFAVVMLATKGAARWLGDVGMYAAAVVSGLGDVDAITLTATELARQGTSPRVAVTTILLACVSNTVAKGAIASVLGGRATGRRVVPAFAAIIGAGIAAVAIVWAVG